MKKVIGVAASLVLVMAFALASFAPASAIFMIIHEIKYPDPDVIPLTGDFDIKVTPVDPSLLTGTEKSDSGLIVPIGFVMGEAQFGGKGAIVTGQDWGTATICFGHPLYQYDWAGTIYQWNGTRWVKLPTSITPGKESAPAWACTALNGNGTYALIIGYFGKPERHTPVLE